ncbi:MAG: hypothetical protein CM1200mP30_21350 [Pseudomonadota bacterium]|nr:MAG: hypothetical protein CM1200mP30_21350 [Pseudomonadota bacterium]
MREFIDNFNTSQVGVYFDVGNVLLTGYPDQWIRILGSRIKRVHIKDFKPLLGMRTVLLIYSKGMLTLKQLNRPFQKLIMTVT